MSFRVVLRKELLDHGRDRRSLTSALIFPVMGPVLFLVSMRMVAALVDSEEPPKLAVEGRTRAPNLVAFLEQHGVEVLDAPSDYEAKVQDGTFDAALVLEEDYGKAWAAGEPAGAQLVIDRSRRKAQSQVDRIERVLEAWGGFIASARLMARGVSPRLAQPVRVDKVDLATPQKLAVTLLNMIPLFLVLGAFVGGMNVAIDATAGERERGSLEPLLINPVGRGAIIGGKWLTTVLVASFAISLTMVGFALAMQKAPLAVLGVKASLGPVEVAAILAAVLPLTLFASALQMLVATYARSFKEAQTYLSLLVLLPTLPGLVMAFNPLEPKLALSLVPVLGQHLLVNRIISQEGFSLVSWALSLMGVGIPAALCLYFCTRLISKERIVFGR